MKYVGDYGGVWKATQNEITQTLPGGPWTEYVLSTILAAYGEFESRFGKLSKGHGSKTDMVRNAVDGFIADFSITDVEKACPKVSRDMIRYVLGQLREAGSIIPVGKGWGAKWRNAQSKWGKK